MSQQLVFSKAHLYRAISVCDFILEDGGHTVSEAAQEFKVCKENIRRDIKIVGIAAYTMGDKIFDTSLNPETLSKKYILVKKTLEKLGKNKN